VSLIDRIRRWWNPAKWRDEHPEVSAGDGFACDTEQRLTDTVDMETHPRATGSIDLDQRC
jgi:hypothetical protein